LVLHRQIGNVQALLAQLLFELGIVDESTYGTYVEPTRFYPFESDTMTNTIARIESASIRAGRVFMDDEDWAPGGKTISGDVNLELRTKDIGLWLKAVSRSGKRLLRAYHPDIIGSDATTAEYQAVVEAILTCKQYAERHGT